MAGTRSTFETVRSTVSTATTEAAAALTPVALGAVMLGWALFGLNLARIHYTMGDPASAVFSGVVAAAPLVAVAVYYYGASSTDLPVDVGSGAPSN